jgi:hypothetical protein
MKYAIPATESNKRMGQIDSVYTDDGRVNHSASVKKRSSKKDAVHTPVEMMRAWPVGLMLALAHGSIRTLAS